MSLINSRLWRTPPHFWWIPIPPGRFPYSPPIREEPDYEGPFDPGQYRRDRLGLIAAVKAIIGKGIVIGNFDINGPHAHQHSLRWVGDRLIVAIGGQHEAQDASAQRLPTSNAKWPQTTAPRLPAGYAHGTKKSQGGRGCLRTICGGICRGVRVADSVGGVDAHTLAVDGYVAVPSAEGGQVLGRVVTALRAFDDVVDVEPVG